MFAFAIRLRRSLSVFVLIVLSISGVVWPATTAGARETLVISQDFGGSVMQRYRKLDQLRLSNTRVELRGQCTSACTMYLGLSQACVTPSARLGFHGPYKRGQEGTLANSPSSNLMAAHYPPALKQWYLDKAQYISSDQVAWVSGRTLITMGVKRC